MEKKRERNRQINVEYEEGPENEVLKHFVCSLEEAQLPRGLAAGKKSVCTPAWGTWSMAQPGSCFSSMLPAMAGMRQAFA